ncbi:MAG: aromatic amino acid transport family protein [bacterium]
MRIYNKNFYFALSTLIGTIIGAGIFGLPYAIYQSGIFLGLVYLLVLGFIMIIIHLLYGEVVLRTEKTHRLVGYGEKYLGEPAKMVLTLSALFGLYGSSIVYIILGGEFLNNIFSGFLINNSFFYSLIFFAVVAILVYFGLKTIKKSEFYLTALLLVTIVIILFLGLTKIHSVNYQAIKLKDVFLPYGVIFFALNGAIAIPELKSILKRKQKLFKKTIILGTLIPLAIYLLFTLVVIGITGGGTSPEALTGLKNKLGDGMVLIGSLFGFLAIATSFLVIALHLKETFIYDYHLTNLTAWLLACFVPLLLFLAGFANFIKIIALVGAIMGGIDGIAVVLIYLKAKKHGDKKPEYNLKLPKVFIYSLIGIFLLGIFCSMIYN